MIFIAGKFVSPLPHVSSSVPCVPSFPYVHSIQCLLHFPLSLSTGFYPVFEFLDLGGVLCEVKNNSKNFGSKKNIELFSKILSKWTFFHSKSSNFLEFFKKSLFSTILFAYAHMNIEYYDFLTFWKWKSHKKSRKFEYFRGNKVHLLKILLNNLYFFLFSKFLELFFTPENTPPMLKNSKMS